MNRILGYHGTSPESAAVIMQEGFRPDAWFALRVEDATAFGGPVVLIVWFDPDKWPRNEEGEIEWQMHHPEAIPPTRIEQFRAFHQYASKADGDAGNYWQSDDGVYEILQVGHGFPDPINKAAPRDPGFILQRCHTRQRRYAQEYAGHYLTLEAAIGAAQP